MKNALSIPLKLHLPRLFIYLLTFRQKDFKRERDIIEFACLNLLRPQRGEQPGRQANRAAIAVAEATARGGSAAEGGGFPGSRSLSTLRCLDSSEPPRWLSGRESTYSAGEAGSIPGKIPWRRKWQRTTLFTWRIPRTEEPGGLQSVGSQRVRHDLATKQQWIIWLLTILHKMLCRCN